MHYLGKYILNTKYIINIAPFITICIYISLIMYYCVLIFIKNYHLPTFPFWAKAKEKETVGFFIFQRKWNEIIVVC